MWFSPVPMISVRIRGKSRKSTAPSYLEDYHKQSPLTYFLPWDLNRTNLSLVSSGAPNIISWLVSLSGRQFTRRGNFILTRGTTSVDFCQSKVNIVNNHNIRWDTEKFSVWFISQNLTKTKQQNFWEFLLVRPRIFQRRRI